MDKALTWFATGWLGLQALLNVITLLWLLAVDPGGWAGMKAVGAIFDPFNVVNLVAEFVFALPAILALWWRARRRGEAWR